MFCVDTVISKHFKMFFRNVNDESFDEIQSRNTFGDCLIVFMSSVMKGYSITVIIIDAGSGDDRTTKITTNIFDCDIWGAKIRFGTNIKAIGMVFVNIIFNFAKRRA